MIKTAPLSINGHIENLKQQLSRNELGQLEYVVIAHPDVRMIQQLKEAFVNNSIAFIALPQNCWAMNEQQMDELMNWLLNDLNVQRVLLVGHSQGGSPSDNVQVCEPGQVQPNGEGGTNRVSSILDRVTQAQACMKQIEQHFIQQLECLENLPSLQKHSPRNGEIVNGLFYRAESGVFCHYDTSLSQFRALILDN